MDNLPSKDIDGALQLRCLCEIINHVNFPLNEEREFIEEAKQKFADMLSIENCRMLSMIEVEAVKKNLEGGGTLREILKIYS